MSKTTEAQLDKKLEYVNSQLKNKLTLSAQYGYWGLEMFGGSKRIATGTKSEIWEVLNGIEEVVHYENKAEVAI